MLFLEWTCIPIPSLVNWRAPVSLETWSSSCGTQFLRHGATQCWDPAQHRLGVLGEAPTAWPAPQLAHVLCHLVPLLEVHSQQVVQTHGYCSSMAVQTSFFLLPDNLQAMNAPWYF